jgi:hypothetical protein
MEERKSAGRVFSLEMNRIPRPGQTFRPKESNNMIINKDRLKTLDALMLLFRHS